MIHKMAGINRDKAMHVLVEGNEESVSNEEKADLLVRTCQKVHRTSNVSREGQLRREQNLQQEGYMQTIVMWSMYSLLCKS